MVADAEGTTRNHRSARLVGRRIGPTLLGFVGGALLAVTLASTAAAHPLGNFTINHYAGIVVAPNEIRLDVVLDQAEIPTFQERQRIDTSGDGALSDIEIEAERQVQCPRRSAALRLTVGGRSANLEVTASGLSFPPGAGGLSTMRVVCEYRSALTNPLASGTMIGYSDTSFSERIGWREIVVQGDGVSITSPRPATTSVSARLTSYPKDLLSQPLDIRSASFGVTSGGPALTTAGVPDAFPLSQAGKPILATAAVPGGVGADIEGLLKSQDLTPGLILLSIFTAMVLGAGHAITPGHGKTIMAAYLVGTRGTARHALGLGMTVTISHTLGVLGLAVVILVIGSVAPDQFNRTLAVLSGVLVIGIGLYMLVGRLRQRARRHDTVHEHPHTDADHAQDHPHLNGASNASDHPRPRGAPKEHAHASDEIPGVHDHGPGSHSHLPATDAPLTWRSLFMLGLFGGLVPSINALIILLATIATGRAAYGLVLVVAFGIGMALVLGGIGLGLVYAARWMARTPSTSLFSRAISWAPLVTALVILSVGIFVTGQAIIGSPVL